MHQTVALGDHVVSRWMASYASNSCTIEVDFRSLSNGLTTDRYTHLIHPYPAKLLPQIPYFLLRAGLLAPRSGELIVADPFCGSGTVLLEGLLRGHTVLGADSNPLARLISRVKTTALPAAHIATGVARIRSQTQQLHRADAPSVVNLAHWYKPSVARELAKIKKTIDELEPGAIHDFMRVCLSVCARKMSNADPRISVPVRINLARKEKYGRHYPELRRHLHTLKATNVLPTFEAIALKNSARTDALVSIISNECPAAILDNVTEIGGEELREKVDLIITSPPYLGAQKYIRTSSLGLGWLDLAGHGQLRPLERKTIGREHLSKIESTQTKTVELPAAAKIIEKIEAINSERASIARAYITEMYAAISSMFTSLKPGGIAVIVVGSNTVCGMQFDTPGYLEELAHRVGFQTVFDLVDRIRSRGLLTKRHPTADLIATERIIGLRKPA